MLLPDRRIQDLIRTKVYDFTNYADVNPCSLNVRLSTEIKVERRPLWPLWLRRLVHSNAQRAAQWRDTDTRWQTVDISGYTEANPYLIPPQGFVLAAIATKMQLPRDLAVEFRLRSSRAREGYGHALAVFADPGYTGYLTLELHNLSRFYEMPLWPGLPIGQLLAFVVAGGGCDRPYNRVGVGRYNNDSPTPEGSKG